MAPRTYNTPAEWASAYMEATSDRRAIANSTAAIATNFQEIRQLEKMAGIAGASARLP
jgi:hypothetical protein